MLELDDDVVVSTVETDSDEAVRSAFFLSLLEPCVRGLVKSNK